MVGELQDEAKVEAQTIKDLTSQAELILNLSSQASLAASYKIESEKLEGKSRTFTVGLYIVGMLTALVAGVYVLGGLEGLVGKANDNLTMGQEAAVLLLRASILAPLVFLLYFTSKQISMFEALRMDYAEKAAASLAYSGYREQMSSDEDLLKQLKAGLLLKFANGPERLLGKRPTDASAKVKSGDIEVETRISSRDKEYKGEDE